MTTMMPEVATNQIAVLPDQARMAHIVVRLGLDGVTHEESLIQPDPAGNCMNWVVGHLLAIYDNILPLLGQRPVLPAAAQKRYDRGSKPIRDGAEALDISELMSMWDESTKRYDAGLGALDPRTLGNPRHSARPATRTRRSGRCSARSPSISRITPARRGSFVESSASRA